MSKKELPKISKEKQKPLKRTRQFPTMTWIVESKVIIFYTKLGDNKGEYEYSSECLEYIKAVSLVTGLCNLMSRNISYKTRKIN